MQALSVQSLSGDRQEERKGNLPGDRGIPGKPGAGQGPDGIRLRHPDGARRGTDERRSRPE